MTDKAISGHQVPAISQGDLNVGKAFPRKMQPWGSYHKRGYAFKAMTEKTFIDDVMELLGCGKNKAIKCMKELDDETGIGLTQKRRQGFGKSNMIYVKTFLVESQAGKQTSLTEPEAAVIEGKTMDTGNSGNENIPYEAKNIENGMVPDQNELNMGRLEDFPEPKPAAEKFKK